MTPSETAPPVGEIPALLRDAALSTLLTDTPRAIALINLDGYVLFSNPAFNEMHHMRPTDPVGVHLREAAPILWVELEAVFDRVRDGFAVELERKTGAPDAPERQRRLLEERWRPVRDDSGEVVAILGSAVDITRARAEREEQERLADLRGRLIETASHELRGPLASILGFAMRLERNESLSPEAAEAAQLIREQAEEMAFRLDLFLGVSELDAPMGAGIQPAEEELLVEDLLVREAQALRARRPQVTVDVHCPTGITVSSNPHYIRQIVANLLDNAAKYGSGWAGLSAEDTGLDLLIRVEDDGDGIAASEQALVFARGYRTQTARALVSPGKGLGLFVAREFAERLGGTLSVKSEEGVGTTFVLRIPHEPRRKPRRAR